MTVENLRCFMILAQELNFTRAAEKAHVSQAAMSRKISSIEAELSARLFIRNHHEVGLTSAGQEFYSQISPILEAYQTAVIRVQNADRGVRDTIQIGVGVYEHSLLLPVIREFIREDSVSKINCVQYKYRDLLEEFELDHLDLIVTSDQLLDMVPQENLEKVLIHDHPWCIALNRDNPLAQSDPVMMNRLGDQNVITMHEGSINMVRSAFQGRFPLTSLDYVNTHETKLMLINAGRGVGFIPDFINVSLYQDVVTRSLEPLYRPRKYYAICKKANSNPFAHRLAQLLGEYYRPSLWLQELLP